MAKKSEKTEQGRPHEPRIRNRKAFHEYHILQKLEAGLALTGTEIKSLRAGQCNLEDAYARIERDELWLVGANIAVYPQAVGVLQHDPLRKRKLLVHRRQLAELQRMVAQKGNTLIPLEIHFSKGYAKIDIGVAVGKKSFDKRQDLKNRQAKRDIDREMHRRR